MVSSPFYAQFPHLYPKPVHFWPPWPEMPLSSPSRELRPCIMPSLSVSLGTAACLTCFPGKKQTHLIVGLDHRAGSFRFSAASKCPLLAAENTSSQDMAFSVPSPNAQQIYIFLNLYLISITSFQSIQIIQHGFLPPSIPPRPPQGSI